MAFGVIKNVRKVFQLEEIGWTALEPVVALDDASFQFEQGELVALLGPSGCGKTTLLRIVGGLIAKSAGSVAIAGREVTKPMGDYGFVFQAPSLMPWRNVLDNVLFPMEILRKNDAAAIATIHQRWSSAQPITPLYRSACRSNQRLKRSSARAIALRRSWASSC